MLVELLCRWLLLWLRLLLAMLLARSDKTLNNSRAPELNRKGAARFVAAVADCVVLGVLVGAEEESRNDSSEDTIEASKEEQ